MSARDERLAILLHYMEQYNRTSNQINRLMTELDHIRHNLDTFSNIIFNDTRNSNTNVSSNTNTNTTSNLNTNANTNANNRSSRFINTFLNNRNTRNTTPITYNFNDPINVDNILNTFLSTTVPIIPTQEQITNATRVVRFEEIQNPLNESCPISLERFNSTDNVTQIRWCGHVFNTNELNSWFRSNVRCPVRSYNTNQTSRTNTTNINTTNTNTTNTTNTNTTNPLPTNSNTTTNANSNTISSFLNNIFTNSSSNNERIVYDPVSNVIMYETVISRNNNDNDSDDEPTNNN
jgi:hypothetical protein